MNIRGTKQAPVNVSRNLVSDQDVPAQMSEQAVDSVQLTRDASGDESNEGHRTDLIVGGASLAGAALGLATALQQFQPHCDRCSDCGQYRDWDGVEGLLDAVLSSLTMISVPCLLSLEVPFPQAEYSGAYGISILQNLEEHPVGEFII